MANKDITIWCTYHDKEQLNEYNLYNTNIIKLFYTNDFELKEDNINYLNPYLSELVTYYYIWKNQIKSDYIGLCHYRRFFKGINYDLIDDNNIQTFYSWETDLNYIEDYFQIPNTETDKLLTDYRDYMYKKYNYAYDNWTSHKKIIISSNLTYIVTWKVFNEICEFMFGFIDYIADKINVNDWKDPKEFDKILSYLSIDKTNIHTRNISIIGEYLIGSFIGIQHNPHQYRNDNEYIIYNIDDKNEFYKMYKLNSKTGITHIVNISNLEYDNYDRYILTNLWDVKNKTQDIQLFINMSKGGKYIILNNNEYIDCTDFVEYNNGNFTIKTI